MNTNNEENVQGSQTPIKTRGKARKHFSKAATGGMIFIGIIALIIMLFGSSLIEINQADTVKVLQSLGGDMSVHKDPGLFYQGFGKVTTWKKSDIVWFSYHNDEGESRDQSIIVRFTDGGQAKVSGSARYIIPWEASVVEPNKVVLTAKGLDLKDEEFTALQRKKGVAAEQFTLDLVTAADLDIGAEDFEKLSLKLKSGFCDQLILAMQKSYRTERNFEDRAIVRLTKEAVEKTAGFLTTEESYTTQKTTYADLVRDQLMYGVYMVDQRPDTVITSTGEEKIVTVSEIRLDPVTGEAERKMNPLKEFQVDIKNVTIYDPYFMGDIPEQIHSKFTRKMDRIVSMSQARLAEQMKDTKEAQGLRDVEKERYLQLVVNVKEEIEAEQAKEVNVIIATAKAEVADVVRQADEWRGKAEIERGRGQAESQKLLQTADSNLDLKLAAIKTKWTQISKGIGAGRAVMPSIIIGGGEGGGGSSEGVMQALEVNQLSELQNRLGGGN